jgi:hypothetical protein
MLMAYRFDAWRWWDDTPRCRARMETIPRPRQRRVPSIRHTSRQQEANMANDKTLITEALRAIKILDGYPKEARTFAEQLQKYFRERSIALTVVTKTIAEGEKDLADYERQVTAAAKTLAAMVKAKSDPATAKKLDAAIGDANAALTSLRVNLAMYGKLATQAAKDDEKIDKVASEMCKIGEPTLRELKAANITVPVQPDAVQEGFEKHWPKQVMVKVFTQVGTDLRAVKDLIAKGEIFYQSADKLLTRRKEAFEPGTIAVCAKLETLKTAVETQLSALRTPYGKAIDELRELSTRLKDVQD